MCKTGQSGEGAVDHQGGISWERKYCARLSGMNRGERGRVAYMSANKMVRVLFLLRA